VSLTNASTSCWRFSISSRLMSGCFNHCASSRLPTGVLQ
jgi:hypothetical protein